jgi:hypothetical protein
VSPLYDRVLRYIDDPGATSFEELALEVFAHQFAACEPYRRFCVARARTPDCVRRWADVPAVPIQAFKVADLCCGPPQRTFLSTGTTEGPDKRSRHRLPEPRLYRRSALAGLRTFLFPDVVRMKLISLVPPPAETPDSSLAQMVAWAMDWFGDDESAYAVGPDGLDVEHFCSLLGEAETSGRLACVMTTTGALIRALDALAQRRRRFRLPHGSRLMDTGGDKGAPRPLSRNGLLHACWNTLAIPGYFAVNEYGMAELSSQFYDNVVAERFRGRHVRRHKAGPHWVRSLVLDASTLRPVEPGARGLLCHFDLANAGSAMAVLSEDVGRASGDGFELLGRAAGAETRGCSLGAAEWNAA